VFDVRPGKAEDVPFILHSWLKRYRDAVHPRLISDRAYYEVQHAVIRKILEAPGLKISVACDKEDENHIYGYCVGEQLADGWTIVHWTYVKGPFRRFGIGKKLVSDIVGDVEKVHYSHRTKLVDFLNKDKQAVFNPYYVWSLL
jgi:GNAT superfamily N-acetyltransferase